MTIAFCLYGHHIYVAIATLHGSYWLSALGLVLAVYVAARFKCFSNNILIPILPASYVASYEMIELKK